MNLRRPMPAQHLNFHLSRQEKLDIANAIDNNQNQQIFKSVNDLLNP